MRRSRQLFFALCAGVGLAIACASKQPPPPAIETQEANLDPPSKPMDDDPDSLGDAGASAASDAGPKPMGGASTPVVTLLEPGKEPRRELRHVFANGGKQKLKLNAKTSVSGANVPLPSISMSGPIDSQITEIKAGNARFKLTAGPFKSGGGGGALAGEIGSIMGSASQKISGWGIITPRGVVVEFHIEKGGAMGQDAPVETGDPFPEEAVGIGARWEVKTTLRERDGPVEQVSAYTLLKADKKSVHTQVSRVQTPLYPDSEGGTAESSGELTFQLGGIYPTCKLNMTRKLSMALPGLDDGAFQLSSDVTVSKR